MTRTATRREGSRPGFRRLSWALALASFTLVAASVQTGHARAATLLAQSRSVSLDMVEQTVGYECYVHTTPSCPQAFPSDPVQASASAPDFALFDETSTVKISHASQNSTLAANALHLTGGVDLTGYTEVLCVYPTCPFPYAVIIEYDSGSGHSQASVTFALSEPARLTLTANVDVSTPSFDGPVSFTDPPTGSFHLTVGPQGGTPLVDHTASISSLEPSVAFDSNDEIVLSPGIYVLATGISGSVSSELFVNAAGNVGSEVMGQVDVLATLEPLAEVPALSLLGRAVLAVLLATLARRHLGS